LVNDSNKLHRLLEYVREGVLALMATSALIVTINLGLVAALSVPRGVGPLIIASSIVLVASILASALTMTGMVNYLASGEAKGEQWLKRAQHSSNWAVWLFFSGLVLMIIQLAVRLVN